MNKDNYARWQGRKTEQTAEQKLLLYACQPGREGATLQFAALSKKMVVTWALS